MKVPYATITIVALAVLTYLFISGGSLYISPESKMYSFGVSRLNPLGAISYGLIHIGFKHMLINLTILFAIGTIAEMRIGWKQMLALFFFTSTLAGIAYAAIEPHYWVIGSSAGVAGVLVAAYLADVKKTVLVLVVAIVFSMYLALPATDATIDYMKELQEKSINQTSEKIVALSDELTQVEEQIQEKLEKGENVTVEVQLKENLSTQLNQTVDLKESFEEQKETIEKGVEKEAKTPPSDRIHLFGALSGVLYMFLFKAEAFEWFINDLSGIKNYITGKLKNRRKR